MVKCRTYNHKVVGSNPSRGCAFHYLMFLVSISLNSVFSNMSFKKVHHKTCYDVLLGGNQVFTQYKCLLRESNMSVFRYATKTFASYFHRSQLWRMKKIISVFERCKNAQTAVICFRNICVFAAAAKVFDRFQRFPPLLLHIMLASVCIESFPTQT